VAFPEGGEGEGAEEEEGMLDEDPALGFELPVESDPDVPFEGEAVESLLESAEAFWSPCPLLGFCVVSDWPGAFILSE
jgi:hypothetical protein